MSLAIPIVRVGVGCFVKCQTEQGVCVLTGKRKGSHGAGAWQLPGGHLEFNETFEECARRETLEETNLEIEQLEFLTASNDIMTSENKHYVTIFMQAVARDPSRLKAMEPHKLDGDWEWVPMDVLATSNKYKPLFTPLANLVKNGSYQDIVKKLSTL